MYAVLHEENQQYVSKYGDMCEDAQDAMLFKTSDDVIQYVTECALAMDEWSIVEVVITVKRMVLTYDLTIESYVLGGYVENP